MCKKYHLLICAVLMISHQLPAQICDSITPVFTVNLTGQPNGTWTSTSVQRDGYCCGVTGSEKCIEFIVTLDSMSNGIRFDIVGGAIPPGALYYQVNCGPPVQVGEPLCLSGPGPHLVTFCKPGNNTNVYQIAALPYPQLSGTQYVSQACSGNLSVIGLIDTSIYWTSIPFNPVYNGYLSCTQDCDSVTINPPSASLPPFVDYEVCGYVVGGCVPVFFCDTMRVYFVNDLAVNITPQNYVICYGSSAVTVTANPTGGLLPYNYLWSTGASTQSISVGAGTYYVQLLDAMNCSVATDSVVVNSFTLPIVANAGPDMIFCTNQVVISLNGSVSGASGGQWIGNGGTFSPSSTNLNATYLPTAAELASGNTQLILVTTGNQGCPADYDTVQVQISPSPVPAITGNINVCAFATENYSATLVSGVTNTWAVTGGTIVQQNNGMVSVDWGNAGTGNVQLTAVNGSGCDSTVSININIAPQPAPIINGPASVCTGSVTQFAVSNPTPGDFYNWSVSGGSIVGSSTSSSVMINWTNAGTAAVSVTQSNSQGCDSIVSVPVTILTMPAPSISGPSLICEGVTVTYTTPLVAGNTYIWNVTGGTVISLNNNSITVNWPTSGSGMIVLNEANTLTCDSTVSMSITIAPQPAPVVSGPASVCTGGVTQYVVTNPTPGDLYFWTIVGGSIVGPSTSSSVMVNWTNAGTATVSVLQSNSQGCDTIVSVPVTVLTMPSPAINGPSLNCAGGIVTYTTPLVAGNTYIWNVTGGTVVSTNNNSITVNWPGAGSGMIVLNEANTLTCDSTVSLNITIAPQPAPVINGLASVCTGSVTQYDVSNPTPGDFYFWTVTGGGSIIGSSTSPSLTVNWINAGAATVTVTQSNSQGCDSTVSVPVNILTMPAPSINGPSLICAGGTVTYSTLPVAGNTYIWNVIGGTVISTNNNSITVNWPGAGSGMVVLNEANTLTCDSTVSISINIAPQPAPVISGLASVCTGSSTQYSVSNPTPGDLYYWTVGGGTVVGSSTTPSLTVNWTNAGTATVTVTQSNSLGCDSTISIPVTVLTMPAPAISGPLLICEGGTVTYTTPLAGGNTYTWNVIGGTVVSVNNNSITVNWQNAGFGMVVLNEANTLTCDSTVSLNITIAPLPAPVINGPLTNCSSIDGTYNVGNLVQGNTYMWNVTNAMISDSSVTGTITVGWNTAGTSIISLTETTIYGCSVTVQNPVTVFASPAPVLSGLQDKCEQDTAIYSVPFTQGNLYYWTVTGGSIVGPTVGNSIEVFWPAAGTGSVTLREVTQNGCDSIVSGNIIINAKPVPAISGPASFCQFDMVTYTVTSINESIYLWSVNNGVISGSNTDSLVNVIGSVQGILSIYITEINNQGCVQNDTLQVVVNSKPEPVISGSSTGCFNTQDNTYTVNSIATGIYQWQVTGGTIVSGLNSNIISVLWNKVGTNVITVTVINSLTGCDSTISRNIFVDSLAAPVISAPALTSCGPMVVNFSGNAMNTSYHYAWDFGNGLSGYAPNPVISYDVPGTYTVTLIATNNTGCADTATGTVEIYPVPVSNFNLSYGTGPYLIEVSELTIQNQSYGATTYSWDFGNGFISDQFEPVYQYEQPGNYTITLLVTNQWGCTDYSQREMEVKLPEGLYIPNAFTPDNDDINDNFSAGLDNITELNIMIFNRWGELIYKSNSPAFKWDGTFKNNPVQQGAYVWVVRAKGIHGRTFDMTGSVTLIR